MNCRNLVLFVVIYIPLFLLSTYSLSFYRERQVDRFLEERHREYADMLAAHVSWTEGREPETMADWANLHTNRAGRAALEYLVEETEYIRTTKSRCPFTPYEKAFAYCELWRGIMPARAVTIEQFWSTLDGNMYSRLEDMVNQGRALEDVLTSEEYEDLVGDMLALSKAPNGKEIDLLYGEVMGRRSPRGSLYSGVLEETQRLAEKAYENYEENVREREFVDAYFNAHVIETLWFAPDYGTMLWMNDAGNCAFIFLHINIYVDLILMVILPLIFSILIVKWYGSLRMKEKTAEKE